MKPVPRREKVRKGFSSPDGLKLLSAAVGGTPDPYVVTPGKGHVSIPEIGNGAPYRGDGWAGIEGVSNLEYKVVPGNPGPHTLKRPRKG